MLVIYDIINKKSEKISTRFPSVVDFLQFSFLRPKSESSTIYYYVRTYLVDMYTTVHTSIDICMCPFSFEQASSSMAE